MRPNEIDRHRLQELMRSGAQVVEVLPHDEYEEMHLPAAINIPLEELNRAKAAQLDRSRPVVVYCHDYQ